MTQRTPAEVVRDLIGPMLDNPSPVVRAAALTGFLAELQDWAAYAAEQRGQAVVEMKDVEKKTYDEIAREIGLGTYQAAQKIVREQRARQA